MQEFYLPIKQAVKEFPRLVINYVLVFQPFLVLSNHWPLKQAVANNLQVGRVRMARSILPQHTTNKLIFI